MSADQPGYRVLLTGVTGFVGKVVLEELSRRAESLKLEQIYVLIRAKKNQAAEVRFREEVVASECFSALPPGWESRVKVLSGDLTEWKLDPATQQELQTELTHVIHCAASVAFDLPVKEAAEANIVSALNLLEVVRGCRKLKRFVDVSTAYVSPHSGNDLTPIPEALVPLPESAELLFKGIMDGSLEEKALLQKLGYPNTYTLTKCLSEHLLTERKGEIPLAIVRPSIISASWQYPRPGWIDSYAAFAGFVGLIGAGMLKCVVAQEETVLDIVPCDVVSHRIIETAFQQTGTPALVQHVVSGVDQGCRIDTCLAGIENYFRRHPVQGWPGLKAISNGGSIAVQDWLQHKLPTMVASAWFGLQGKTRQKRQIQKVVEKIQYLNDAFPYFTHNTFRFESATPMALAGFDARLYIERVCKGVHTHLMRAKPSETLLGGADHRHPKGDLAWAQQQPRGNWAIRTAAYVVRKGLRRSNDRITFDRESFETALSQVPAESLLILVPSHRSYMDFVLCSYLVFAHPELNIAIPRIAAASDFGKLPLLGWFLQKTHAFYIRRGTGKADPELTERIQTLVSQNETLEFFVEGTRSRSRQFLAPKRGILRALQQTGVSCTLLPIAISYDLVPEARPFLQELQGGAKERMKMRTFLRWTGRLAAGKIRLGQVHLSCGTPLNLDGETDIHALSHSIVGELQDKTAVSTLHLQAFLQQHPVEGVDLEWLQKAIQARGGQVIASPLQDVQRVDWITERTMRYHWKHYFYPDVLALLPGHPVFSRHTEDNAYLPVWKQAAPGNPREDAILMRLLHALFESMTRDYTRIVDLARQQGHLPIKAEAIVAASPEIFLPVAEEVLKELCERALMKPDPAGERLVPGENWEDIRAFALACGWHEALNRVKTAS